MSMKKNEVFDSLFWKSSRIFIVVVVLICLFPIIFTTIFTGINFTDKGAIGDTIGGTMGPFIAIAAAGLTFLAFWVQYKANEQQKEDILDLKTRAEKEKLETKFFEMIKFHRDNVGELSYTFTKKQLGKFSSDDLENEQTAVTREVFRIIYSDFLKINQELSHFFENVNEKDIYEESYLNNLKTNFTLQNRQIDLLLYAKIDILYCILYFGLSYEDQQTIRIFFNNRYKDFFYEPIIQFAALKPKEESEYWRDWFNFNFLDSDMQMKYFDLILESEDDPICLEITNDWSDDDWNVFRSIRYSKTYDKYYGGHQFRLGHYFRHLYQAVTFIDESELIDYDQKYLSIKLLRGQLSSYEQSIIFLNSISILGRIWEFENRENPEMAIDVNKQLITKYNFIKNILSDKIANTISVFHFYPLVSYEANFNAETEEKRNVLKGQYYQIQLKKFQDED